MGRTRTRRVPKHRNVAQCGGVLRLFSRPRGAPHPRHPRRPVALGVVMCTARCTLRCCSCCRRSFPSEPKAAATVTVGAAASSARSCTPSSTCRRRTPTCSPRTPLSTCRWWCCSASTRWCCPTASSGYESDRNTSLSLSRKSILKLILDHHERILTLIFQ